MSTDFESKVILTCGNGQRTFNSLEIYAISILCKFVQEGSPCNFKYKTNPSEYFP